MNMADEMIFHVGVKGIIQNRKGKVLLMREDVSTHSIPTTEYWDFPGGRIQEGETLLDGLRREIAEETGMTKISVGKLITAVLSNHQIKLKNGDIVGLVLMVYEVTVPDTTEPVLSYEHLDYEWVSISVAKERLTHKYPEEFTKSL